MAKTFWKSETEGCFLPQENNIDQLVPKPLAGGTKYDQGKNRWDLIPYGALEEVTKVYTGGAGKYEDWNWAKGIKYSRIFAALLRHLISFWWQKQRSNEEDFGLHPLSHVVWCALTLLHYEQDYEQYKSFDDRR